MSYRLVWIRKLTVDCMCLRGCGIRNREPVQPAELRSEMRGDHESAERGRAVLCLYGRLRQSASPRRRHVQQLVYFSHYSVYGVLSIPSVSFPCEIYFFSNKMMMMMMMMMMTRRCVGVPSVQLPMNQPHTLYHFYIHCVNCVMSWFHVINKNDNDGRRRSRLAGGASPSFFRSTSKSRPNNIRGKCPSVRPQKVSSI